MGQFILAVTDRQLLAYKITNRNRPGKLKGRVLAETIKSITIETKRLHVVMMIEFKDGAQATHDVNLSSKSDVAEFAAALEKLAKVEVV